MRGWAKCLVPKVADRTFGLEYWKFRCLMKLMAIVDFTGQNVTKTQFGGFKNS